MSEPLATVTAYWRREDAGVAKRALDGAGIDAAIEETSVAKVRVERVQAVRAGDVLNRTCDELDEVGEPDEDVDLACPACGSDAVHSAMRGRLFASIATIVVAVSVAVGQSEAAFFILFAAAVYVLMAPRSRCEDCGARWS